jgi:hypothetical protein
VGLPTRHAPGSFLLVASGQERGGDGPVWWEQEPTVGVVMSGMENYRNSEQEKSRTANLVRLLPRGRSSVLDIGACDGFFLDC